MIKKHNDSIEISIGLATAACDQLEKIDSFYKEIIRNTDILGKRSTKSNSQYVLVLDQFLLK